MTLRRDALFGILSLLLIVGVTVFGTIGLLERMRPAIRVTLDENLVSLAAAESALIALARAGGAPLDADQRANFTAALDAIAANLTVSDERPRVATLLALRSRVIAADPEATRVSVRALEEVLALNRRAMHTADRRAQQLAIAGAWATVFLALLAVLIGYTAMRTLDRRLFYPVAELRRVLASAVEGEAHRRLSRHAASRDFDGIFEDINALLDRQIEALGTTDDPETALVRAALAHMLDQRDEPTYVVEYDGAILAANEVGLEALAGADGGEIRQALREARTLSESPTRAVPAWLTLTPIEGMGLYVCAVVVPPSSPQAS